MVKVQHFGGSVKRLPHVVEEYVHDLQQELHGLLLTILSGQQICGQSSRQLPLREREAEVKSPRPPTAISAPGSRGPGSALPEGMEARRSLGYLGLLRPIARWGTGPREWAAVHCYWLLASQKHPNPSYNNLFPTLLISGPILAATGRLLLMYWREN